MIRTFNCGVGFLYNYSKEKMLKVFKRFLLLNLNLIKSDILQKKERELI